MNSIPTMSIPSEPVESLRKAKHVVIFTGAGVSAESGIPTFRDALTGLWENFDAENLATPDAFRKDKALVWGWYEWRRMKVLLAQPNSAHLAIAECANRLPKFTLITQNVDDLHERAGSVDVLHLHGSLHSPRCFACGRQHFLSMRVPQEPEGGRRLDPPICTHCGGSIRPGVVWFGESLDHGVLNNAWTAVETCDMLIAIGTSGIVQPAAGLPAIAQKAGASVIQINPTATTLDRHCTWSLRGDAGVVLPHLIQLAFPR